MYIFGGKVGDVFYGDLYELDTLSSPLSWRLLHMGGPARAGHSAVFLGESMYVFGGFDGSGTLNDLQMLELSSLRWSQPEALGQPPSPRWGHSAALGSSSQMTVFGGNDRDASAEVWYLTEGCRGEVTLESEYGAFSVSEAKQLSFDNCTWRVVPSRRNRQVHLLFSHFFVSGSVQLHDGSQLLGTFSGTQPPGLHTSSSGSKAPSDSRPDSDSSPPLTDLLSLLTPYRLTAITGGLRVTFHVDASSKNEFDASFKSVCSVGHAGSECLPCRPGYHAGRSGQDACEPCGTTAFQSDVGASACIACPRYSEATSSSPISMSECLCAPGSYLLSSNASLASPGASACQACPAGADCSQPGSVAPLRALPGWCLLDEQHVLAKCCDSTECQGGLQGCSGTSTAPIGEVECESSTFRLLTMTTVAFVVTLVISGLVAAASYIYGYRRGVKGGLGTGFKLANAALEDAAVVPHLGAVALPVGTVPIGARSAHAGRCPRGALDAETAQTIGYCYPNPASKSTSSVNKNNENQSPIKYRKALRGENGEPLKVQDF